VHPPTQTERQALSAAIGAATAFIAGFEDDATQEGVPQILAQLRNIGGDAAPDPIVLTPIAAPNGAMKWHTGAACSGWVGGRLWHRFQRMYGNSYAITWFGEETMVDQHGRAWSREFDAVIDDFGNLVEVAR
jgi:hypothetical protein